MKQNTTNTQYPVVFATRFGNVNLYRTRGRTKDEFVISWHHVGKRKREKFTDESEAFARAEEIVFDLNKTELDRAKMSNSELAEYRAAKELLKGASLIEACRFFTQFRSPVKDLTVAEVGKNYLDEVVLRNKSDRHQTTTKYRIGIITAKLGAKKMRAITREDLLSFLSSLNKFQPKTRNTITAMLRMLWKHGQQSMGVVPFGLPHAAANLPLIEELNSEDADVEIYSPEELQTLLDATHAKVLEGVLPKWVLAVVALGGLSGIRMAEIARLHWDHIRFDEGYILLNRRQTKTKKRRLLPIKDSLAAWLKLVKKDSGRVAEGCVYDYNSIIAKEAFGSEAAWKHNGLRHSYISYLMAEMGDPSKVSDICGNSVLMVKNIYQKLTLPEDARRYFQVHPTPVENGGAHS